MTVKNYSIPSAVYFIITALLIAYFFPREGKFRYQFHEGKPWRYGLLTAPSNFPIYKTDKEVALEKDSVLKNFKPYYRINQAIESDDQRWLVEAPGLLFEQQVGQRLRRLAEAHVVGQDE